MSQGLLLARNTLCTLYTPQVVETSGSNSFRIQKCNNHMLIFNKDLMMNQNLYDMVKDKIWPTIERQHLNSL